MLTCQHLGLKPCVTLLPNTYSCHVVKIGNSTSNCDISGLHRIKNRSLGFMRRTVLRGVHNLSLLFMDGELDYQLSLCM